MHQKSMYKKVGAWLGTIAVICAIVGFILTQILHRTLIEILAITVSVPLWIIVIIVVFIVVFLTLLKKQSLKLTPLSPVIHKVHHKITSKRKISATPFPSKFLQSPSGSIASWAYLQPFGEGIRKLINNRYIVAHDSNFGNGKQIGNHFRYVNVFALCYGPKFWSPPHNPVWKLWLANGNGEGRDWQWEDSEEFKPGWHHFLIRWNHGQPLLELLIDGNSVIRRDDYRKYWPDEYADQALLGTWANRSSIHFIETWLWRTIPSFNFLDDAWLNKELTIVQPQLP